MSRMTDRLKDILDAYSNIGIRGSVAIFSDLHLRRIFHARGERHIYVRELDRRICLRDLPGDVGVFTQIFVRHEYDTRGLPHHAAFMAAANDLLVRGKRPLIIDCGAHIGLSSLWFASQFRDAILYAIEPDRRNFELLRKNVEPCPNIYPVMGAVWDRAAHLEYVNPNAESWEIQVEEIFTDTEELPGDLRVCTIPEIVGIAEADEIFIVKIDIEGAERFVFRSNIEWLSMSSLIVIELHDWMLPWKGCGQAFLSAMAGRPFDYVVKGENLFCFNRRLLR